MTHYLSNGCDFHYSVDMGCHHLTPATRNCSGKCEECRYGIASLKIADFLRIAELAGCNKTKP